MFLPYCYPFLPEDLPYIVLTIVQKFKFRVLEEATKFNFRCSYRCVGYLFYFIVSFYRLFQ